MLVSVRVNHLSEHVERIGPDLLNVKAARIQDQLQFPSLPDLLFLVDLCCSMLFLYGDH